MSSSSSSSSSKKTTSIGDVSMVVPGPGLTTSLDERPFPFREVDKDYITNLLSGDPTKSRYAPKNPRQYEFGDMVSFDHPIIAGKCMGKVVGQITTTQWIIEVPVVYDPLWNKTVSQWTHWSFFEYQLSYIGKSRQC